MYLIGLGGTILTMWAQIIPLIVVFVFYRGMNNAIDPRLRKAY